MQIKQHFEKIENIAGRTASLHLEELQGSSNSSARKLTLFSVPCCCVQTYCVVAHGIMEKSQLLTALSLLCSKVNKNTTLTLTTSDHMCHLIHPKISRSTVNCNFRQVYIPSFLMHFKC